MVRIVDTVCGCTAFHYDHAPALGELLVASDVVAIGGPPRPGEPITCETCGREVGDISDLVVDNEGGAC